MDVTQSVEDLEELRRIPDLRAEIVGALAVLQQLLRREAMQVVEQRRQREAQLELLAAPLVLVGQPRRQGDRGLQVADGLATGEALARARRGRGEVAQRARVIAAALEVDRQLGGDLRRALPVGGLEGLADALVQALPASRPRSLRRRPAGTARG